MYRCLPSYMAVHWKVCVPSGISTRGGVRPTAVLHAAACCLFSLRSFCKQIWKGNDSGGMDEKTQKGWGQKEAEEKGYHCCEGRCLKHENIYRSIVFRWELTANKRIHSPVWHQGLQTYTSGVCWFSRAGKTSNCCLSKALCEFTAPQTLRLRIIALWAAEVMNLGCQETSFLDPCSFPLPISAPAMLPDPHINSTTSRHQRLPGHL